MKQSCSLLHLGRAMAIEAAMFEGRRHFPYVILQIWTVQRARQL